MTESQSLLAEYVQTGSDAAFRKLVARYVDLVYSTALRRVKGDTHRAEDVAQTVFVDLARTARTLANDVMLGGWLHRHTCFVASKTMRGELRRQSRERQAVEMNALQTNSRADFSLVAPILDDAINELGEADRTAILLRFFEQHDFRSVGEALGSNEDAARMRVTRALDKLQGMLKCRGVMTSAATLSVALTASAVQAAPVELAVTISTAATLAGTAIAATATATATKAIAMTVLQKTLITATLAVVASTGIYEARQASTLRSQVQTLQQQQAPLTGQLLELQRERDDATNRLAALKDDNERLNRNTTELLKLRGEVGGLRSQVAQFNQLQERNRLLETQNAVPQNQPAKLPTPDVHNERMLQMTAAMKMLVNEMNTFARDNNGHYPTNFNQFSGHMGWVSLNAPGGDIGLDSFEVVNAGSSRDAESKTILLRERTSHKNPNGRWERFYVSSDGSVERIQSDDDNFEAWERLHMVLPSSSK